LHHYRELRRVVREDVLRDEPERLLVLRAVARPPLAPAFFTDMRPPVFERELDFRADVLRLEPDDLRAVLDLRELVLRDDVLREPALREPVLRELVLRELVLRAVARPPFAPAFLTDMRPPVEVLRPDVLRADVLRAPVLRADVFREDDVLRADVLREDEPLFERELVLDFLRDVPLFLREPELRVDPERELELREELRVPERDEERVVAGTARATSAASSAVVSPIAESPHISSAVSPLESLIEPAVDVSFVSPVPLQSSWVINDLLFGLRVHDSLPRPFVTCNADG